jgi:hypothetical protein
MYLPIVVVVVVEPFHNWVQEIVDEDETTMDGQSIAELQTALTDTIAWGQWIPIVHCRLFVPLPQFLGLEYAKV